MDSMTIQGLYNGLGHEYDVDPINHLSNAFNAMSLRSGIRGSVLPGRVVGQNMDLLTRGDRSFLVYDERQFNSKETGQFSMRVFCDTMIELRGMPVSGVLVCGPRFNKLAHNTANGLLKIMHVPPIISLPMSPDILPMNFGATVSGRLERDGGALKFATFRTVPYERAMSESMRAQKRGAWVEEVGSGDRGVGGRE